MAGQEEKIRAKLEGTKLEVTKTTSEKKVKVSGKLIQKQQPGVPLAELLALKKETNNFLDVVVILR